MFCTRHVRALLKEKTFTKTSLMLVLLAAEACAQTAANWTEQMPKGFVPPREGHAMAFDSAHAQVVLFGGDIGFGNAVNDTEVWDGADWATQFPQTSPRVRLTHAMAYDSTHRQVVLFGGYDSTNGITVLDDTWVWDGADWIQKSPTTSPSARSGHAMGFDSGHGQVILFGGYDVDPSGNNIALNDTWLWDGSKWSQASPQTSPPARSGVAMAYDSIHGQVVLFGGFDSKGHGLNDTWVWDGANWTQKFPLASPSARAGHGMAYDSAHDQVVLFGGTSDSFLNDTWLWDGSNWRQASPPTSPSARASALAYDSARNKVVLFGGFVPTPDVATIPFVIGETWTWSGGPLVPSVKAVVNGASFAGGGVVPGEIATLFGNNITSSTGINLSSSLPLPTEFLKVSVTVNSPSVPLFAVDNFNGQQQINFQVPWEVASGPMANIAVTNDGTTSASIAVPVLAAQPGIFYYTVGGDTFGAILHADFQLANTADPAKAQEIVLIYCTGLGAVSSPPADGAAGNGEGTMELPTVTIGGAKAIVSFSGLAPGFVGLYQINAEVPSGLTTGNQQVVVTLAGASSNSVLLPVQ